MRLFLFYIDGTLLLSGGAGTLALDLAFADLFGIQGAMAKVSCDGKTDPLIAREVLGPRGLDSPGNIDACLSRYVEHLERTLPEQPGYHLLPGAVGGVDPALLRAQITNALQNNPDEVKRLFLSWAESEKGGA